MPLVTLTVRKPPKFSTPFMLPLCRRAFRLPTDFNG